MHYYTIPPPAHLAKYVRYFWVAEGKASTANPHIHHAMAVGCPELLFHYKGGFDRLSEGDIAGDCFVSGVQAQSATARRFYAPHDFGMFGVSLYPYTIPQLFAIPSSVFTGEMPDLQTLLGSVAPELEERVMLAASNNRRVAIVSSLLEAKLPHIKPTAPGITETIAHILDANSAFNVAEFAQQNFLSVGQFERTFKTYSGFSPKLFLRIARFRAAVKEYHKQEKSLTAIAHQSGYHDQSHFIRDFKEFSGYSPKQYFSGKAGSGVLIEG